MMAAQTEPSFTLELDTVKEFFSAPNSNPFSAHEVDILGESGIDLLQKRVMWDWPRLEGQTRLTLRLPADQITSELEQQTRLALDRYCQEKIEENRLQRKLTIRSSLRQVVPALIFFVIIIALIPLLSNLEINTLSPILIGIFQIVMIFAAVLALFDAMYGLFFDWLPYIRENMAYRCMKTAAISIEPVDNGSRKPVSSES